VRERAARLRRGGRRLPYEGLDLNCSLGRKWRTSLFRRVRSPSGRVDRWGQVQGGPVDFCHWTNWAELPRPTGPSPLGHSRPNNTFDPSKAHLTADY
jgi:hypothetical protein